MQNRTCAYCGKRISRFVFSSETQFCSADHRTRYQQDMERLAIESMVRAERVTTAYLRGNREAAPNPPEPASELQAPDRAPLVGDCPRWREGPNSAAEPVLVPFIAQPEPELGCGAVAREVGPFEFPSAGWLTEVTPPVAGYPELVPLSPCGGFAAVPAIGFGTPLLMPEVRQPAPDRCCAATGLLDSASQPFAEEQDPCSVLTVMFRPRAALPVHRAVPVAVATRRCPVQDGAVLAGVEMPPPALRLVII